MKKLLTIVLTILMVFTLLPIKSHIIVAEEGPIPEAQNDDPITEGEVIQEIIVDSLIAKANEELAVAKASEAIIEDKVAEKILEDIVENSDEALEDSKAALEDSKNGLNDARHEAYEQDKEGYKEALANTVEASFDANKAALEAKAAYDQAIIAKDLAIKKIDEDLKQGLISSEKAVELTQKAKDVADAYYKQMVEAEAEAQEKQAKAKEDAETAKEELKDAVQSLEVTVLENTAEVIQDTTVAVITGVVYEVTKIVSDVADNVVDKYEGDIEELENEIQKLDESIQILDEKIGELEDAVDKASDDYDNSILEAYNLKTKILLEQCKEEAEAILAKKKEAAYKEDMEKYQKALNDGSLDTKEKINQNIKDLTETVVSHVNDVDNSKKGNMQILWKEGEGNFFYYVDKDGNPIENDVFYQAKIVGEEGSQYIQFFKARENLTFDEIHQDTKAGHTEVVGKEGATETLTKFKAYDEDGNELTLQVVINRKGKGTKLIPYYNDYVYQVIIDGQPVDLRTDLLGNVYLQYNAGTKWNPNYRDIKVQMFDDSLIISSKAESTNSNTITDKWNSLEDVEAKKAALEEAEKALQECSEFAEKVELENQKQELTKELEKLNKKLNGNSVDKFIRGLVELDKDSFSAIKEILDERDTLLVEREQLIQKREEIGNDITLSPTQKMVKRLELDGKILAKDNDIKNVNRELLSEYGKSDLFKDFIAVITDQETYQDSRENLDEIYEFSNIMQTLFDANLGVDDVKAIFEIVENSSLSAKTKATIAHRIEEFARIQHEHAVEELRKAIEKTDKEFKEDVTNILEKTSNLIVSEGKLLRTSFDLYNTKALRTNAERLQMIADYQNQKAIRAYENYKKVLINYKGELNGYVKEARHNYLLARENARTACENAKKAWDIAEVFNNAYDAEPQPDQGIIKIKSTIDTIDPDALISLIVKKVSVEKASEIATMMGFIPENVIVIDAYIAQDGRRINGPVETEDKVNIYITVPEEYVNRPLAAGTNTRLYTVTMWHDANNNGQIDEGEIEIVLRDGTINDKNQLVIKSDKFSYFVISSRDVYRGSGSKEFTIPNTGITVSGLVSGIGYISLTAFVVFALLALKKKLINSK